MIGSSRSSTVHLISLKDHGNCSSRNQSTGDMMGTAVQGTYARLIRQAHGHGRDISAELGRLDSLLKEANSLYERVRTPKDQIADAGALLRISESLYSSLKSVQNTGKILPSEFISILLKRYGKTGTMNDECDGEGMVGWVDVGLDASHIFGKAPGLQTMIGPMDASITPTRVYTRRKRPRPRDVCHPEPVKAIVYEETSDTFTKVSAMFDVLKRKKLVQLEKLVLNRDSFSETVENIFALSFLVKDGRSEIRVNHNGVHLVAPRNAPKAGAIKNGGVTQHQFVFRFDFRDWKVQLENLLGGCMLPGRIALVAITIATVAMLAKK